MSEFQRREELIRQIGVAQFGPFDGDDSHPDMPEGWWEDMRNDSTERLESLAAGCTCHETVVGYTSCPVHGEHPGRSYVDPDCDQRSNACPSCSGTGVSAGSNRPDDFGPHQTCKACNGSGISKEN